MKTLSKPFAKSIKSKTGRQRQTDRNKQEAGKQTETGRKRQRLEHSQFKVSLILTRQVKSIPDKSRQDRARQNKI